MPFANIQTCYLLNYSIKIKLATEEGNGRNERWTLKKTRNWSSCTKFAPSVSCTHDLFDDDLNSWPDIYTKLALRVSWTHGVIAQSVSRTEFSGHGFKSHSGQLSITTSKKSFRDEYCMYQFIPLQRDDLCETSLKSKCGDWRRQRPEWNVNTEQRCNWSSCTKLALRVSWTHGLISQSVRASERNSLVVGSNPTQANFL